MFGGLRRVTVDGEGAVGAVDGAPVFDVGFEGGFDFPFLTRFSTRLGREEASWDLILAADIVSGHLVSD
jgi:hypothetical protein